jgi:hypothetical protein
MTQNRLGARVAVLFDGGALIQDTWTTTDFVRHPGCGSGVEVDVVFFFFYFCFCF